MNSDSPHSQSTAQPASGAAFADGDHPRDHQRAALRDLVVLAAQCAATEARIERDYQTTVAQAEQDFKNTAWSIQQRHKATEDAIRQKYQDRAAQIGAEAAAQGNSLAESDASARRKVEHEHDPIRRRVKEKLDQAVWLADSVLDVAKNRAAEQKQQIEHTLEERVDDLDAIDQRAASRVVAYRLQAPHDDQTTAAPSAADAPSDYDQARGAVETRARGVRRQFLAGLYIGSRPVLLILALAAAGGAAGAKFGPFNLTHLGIGSAAGLAGALLLGTLLRIVAKRQVVSAWTPLRAALQTARQVAETVARTALAAVEADLAAARRGRDDEVKRARDQLAPIAAKAQRTRDSALAALTQQLQTDTTALAARKDTAAGDAEQWLKRQLQEVGQRRDLELEGAKHREQTIQSESRGRHDRDRSGLESRLRSDLDRIDIPGNQAATSPAAMTPASWEDAAWQDWSPPKRFTNAVRFGHMRVDLKRVAQTAADNGAGADHPQAMRLQLPDAFDAVATLAFPHQASLLIQTDRAGRAQGMAALQMVMTRLLTSLPAGRMRFTLIDPVGLGQNFAGFMHLADYDEALVGGRIWTDAEQIDRRLTDLTEHMETVIQKYLRNEFATIDDYNAQAGELAEPYRFLVIADLPTNFSAEAMGRLASIAASGARCGVYTLILRDSRHSLFDQVQLDELEAASVNLIFEAAADAENGAAGPVIPVWRDEVFGQFALTVDPAPSEAALTRILHRVGQAARESKRVEVSFATIAPPGDQWWSLQSDSELRVPIGRMGATRLQQMKLGRGVAQHVLIAGKTGSGKSTLLHALVTNLAMWYAPDQVEFYLIDFKKGVEFKTYVTHRLPHARAIAVESDREFGLSVLRRLDAELGRRGDLFRKAGVQDLPSYRQTADAVTMPRTLLIIDEFQEFFSEDDKLAQEAGLLLDRLVRQGRAFGVHVLLGSQTIGGTSGLARSTLGQMAVRIALQTSEADSQLILGDNNMAARLLARPGEAIYNDQGGLIEANSPFQIAWLNEEHREQYLEKVRAMAERSGPAAASIPIVFEGNAPADIAANPALATLLDGSAPKQHGAPLAWLGEPVAIKEPTSVAMRRQSGANLLIVGQQEDAAMAMLASAMLSLAARQSPQECRFVLFDGTPADSPLCATLPAVIAALPHPVQVVDWRGVNDTVAELAAELQRRQADPQPGDSIYVMVYGLQRYRTLRKSDDDFAFSLASESGDKPVNTGKQFADLLREGPPLGIHILAWIDTATAIERTLDRASLREFDNRVLMQVSAADSSTLIDSPAANKLGFHRAIAFSEEQGTMEKFRPYGLPSEQWLKNYRAAKCFKNIPD